MSEPTHAVTRGVAMTVAPRAVVGPAGRGANETVDGIVPAVEPKLGSVNSSANDRLARHDGDQVRVLLIDDEPNVSQLLAMAIRMESWRPITASDGESAMREFRLHQPDVVMLDLMLPDIDGLDLLRRMREDSPDTPVLMLTAKAAVGDRIAGLSAGGDDYVTKPFSVEEVVLRIRALLRRAGTVTSEGNVLTVGDLTLDEDSHEARRGGETIHLTHTEFKLLRYLMINPRRVLSKNQILQEVWDYDFGRGAHIVELYISYLRRKIDTGREPLIHTVRGAGYVLKPPS